MLDVELLAGSLAAGCTEDRSKHIMHNVSKTNWCFLLERKSKPKHTNRLQTGRKPAVFPSVKPVSPFLLSY